MRLSIAMGGLLWLACCGGSGDGGAGGCADGSAGAACDLCTWESDEAGCHPLSPAGIFDIDAIKALSLVDLGWEFPITSPLGGGGVTRTLCNWDAGTFPAIAADGRYVEQEIRALAALYTPAGWPATPNADKAIVYAMHSVGEVTSPVPAFIAAQFGIAVLCHAEYASNWEDNLGYVGPQARGQLNAASWRNVIATNPCVPIDYTRGNYQYFAIPQRAMRAVTLVQRLAEAAGGSIDEVAVRGFSKEGGGLWIAIAVDDRITVAAPGGHPIEDQLAMAQTWIESFGCDGIEMGHETARGMNDFNEWFRHTPAGAGFLHAFDTSRNQDLFFPTALIIDGDVHGPDMHDGQYYPLGAETGFLDSLAVNHRFVRKALSNSDSLSDAGDAVSTTNVLILLAELLVTGAGAFDTYYPRVTGATASIVGGTLSVNATVLGPVERAKLWWSWSDDRSWSEPGQAPWSSVELTTSPGGWGGSVDLAVLGVAGKPIAWYVEASNTLLIGLTDYPRMDASPVRFLQLPPVGACPPSTVDFCAGH